MEDDVIREMYDISNNILTSNEYIHYEVSCWAKKDKVSKHNLAYWTNEHYFGAGLGASGYVNKYRYKNIKNILKYNESLNKIEETELVNGKDDKLYEIYLNLRTYFGLDLNKFKSKFNEDLLKSKKVEIEHLIEQNLLLLDEENNILKATYDGMMTLDSIVLSLI